MSVCCAYVVCGLAGILTGCGPRSALRPERGLIVSIPKLVTRGTTWRGWQAIEQSNGLTTLRHVPGIGGRTMSLEINGYDCLLVFPDQEGTTYPADSRQRSVHFGGHYSCIGPETKWNVHEQAFNPHAGPYQHQIDTRSATEHVVTLTSKPGTWRGATYQIIRTITVRTATTHVTVDEGIYNCGAEPLEFYLWDFTQIDALDRTKPDCSLRNLHVYVPLPPGGAPGRYDVLFCAKPEVREQFNEELAKDVLDLRYVGGQCKIASHASRWWLACVDHDSGWTYVKTFEPESAAKFVDGNGPIEVYTSEHDRQNHEAFIEMELLTGIDTYPPGGVLQQREHWYLTTCFGPVVGLTDVGITAERLKARRMRQGGSTGQVGASGLVTTGETQRAGESVEVTGRYGVFWLGSVRVWFLDASGNTLAQSPGVRIDPRRELRLRQTLTAPPGSVRAVLVVLDHNGRAVGTLDAVALGSS